MQHGVQVCLTRPAFTKGSRRLRVVALGVVVVCLVAAVLTPAVALAINPPVVFADTNLESAVHSALGIPTTTPIYQSDMLNLTSLTAEHSSIARLDGLEYATNLTYLDLDFNTITTITPLGGLTKLDHLYMQNNQVADLTPLVRLKNLMLLGLPNNNISDITPVSELTTLTGLWLYGNHITDIGPVSALTKLSTLNLTLNNITDVAPLGGLTKLTWLDVSYNQICDIAPLHGLPIKTARVRWNWLDLTPSSPASQTIDTWLENGASVTWLPQNVGGGLKGTVSLVGGGSGGDVSVSVASGPATTTAADGSYLLRVVPTGVRTLTFSEPFYASYTTTLAVSPSTTYTVDAVLTPLQLSPTLKRSPSSSSLTYKRKKGKAKFTLGVTIADARGAVAHRTVWLQKSSTGKKWSTLYRLTTSSTGKASEAFSVRKKGTAYYRWYVPATAFDRAGVNGKQRVVVK